MRTIDQGWLVYYLGRGKNERPDQSANLMTAWSSPNGGELKLDPEFMKARKFKDMKGYYIVGITCSPYITFNNQDPVRYTLKVVTNENDPQFVSMNFQYSFSLVKGKPKQIFINGLYFDKKQKLSMVVDSGNKDLDIYFKEKDCKSYA